MSVLSVVTAPRKKKNLSFLAVHLQPAHTENLEPCKHPDLIGQSLHIKSFENSSIAGSPAPEFSTRIDRLIVWICDHPLHFPEVHCST